MGNSTLMREVLHIFNFGMGIKERRVITLIKKFSIFNFQFSIFNIQYSMLNTQVILDKCFCIHWWIVLVHRQLSIAY
jgi:hypothetical protein